MKDINERLTDMKTKMKEKERLTSILTKLSTQKNEAMGRRTELLKQLRKEQEDVEKLENLSFSNFLHTVLGNKVEKLEKEKEELISAKLSFDTANAEVERLERELDMTRKRILDIGDVQKDYIQLMKEKEKILIDKSDSYKEKLEGMLEEEARIISEHKELGEAIQAGNELLSSLNSVQKSLRSAGNWGTWDMLGGGLLSTMAKHSNIDEAQREINDAQYLMKKFHRELQDIGGEINLSIEIGSFLTFADYFFDGFFADIAVQSKINDAQDRVWRAIEKVEKILRDLNRRYEENNRKYEELGKERARTIEEA